MSSEIRAMLITKYLRFGLQVALGLTMVSLLKQGKSNQGFKASVTVLPVQGSENMGQASAIESSAVSGPRTGKLLSFRPALLSRGEVASLIELYRSLA